MRCSASENRRLADRLAEARLQEIEIAALVGLLDVTREHEPVTALIARLRRLPCRAPLGELAFRYVKADAPPSHVERDNVAAAYQRERSADVGFGRDVQ